MKLLLFITIFNYIFQSVNSFDFIRELFFPRNPILHRTRMTRRNFDNGILDFVSIINLYLNKDIINKYFLNIHI